MTFKDALSPERIVFLDSGSRADAISDLVPLLSNLPGMPDADKMMVAFLQREEMMSTGIGMGIGVPHIRMLEISDLVMAVGIHRTGIYDYPALDNLPVKIVAMIAAGVSQHGEYIKMLSNIVMVLKSAETRELILATSSVEEIYHILCEG
ncbi:MAG: PTS sugar transporter subunit IIA [Kiritimatiellae bacterium]|nr:PTS sugar transporter subunit IIA [Kiritimatiellia bacterium]